MVVFSRPGRTSIAMRLTDRRWLTARIREIRIASWTDDLYRLKIQPSHIDRIMQDGLDRDDSRSDSVTDADYHSLSQTADRVGADGSFYERTHVFPDLAMRRLAGALAGYYVLFVERPESRRTLRDVRTELTRRKGRVFAATSLSGGER